MTLIINNSPFQDWNQIIAEPAFSRVIDVLATKMPSLFLKFLSHQDYAHRYAYQLMDFNELSALQKKLPPQDSKTLQERIAQSEIHEMFRGVSPKEMLHWQKIAKTVEATTPAAVLENHLQAFKKGEWNHAVLQVKDWLALALLDFQKGLLSREQLAKLCYYDTALLDYSSEGVQPVQLVRANGTFDEEVKMILEIGLKKNFSNAEISTLFQVLQQLPPHETQFFIVPQSENFLLNRILYESQFKFCGAAELQLIFPPALFRTIVMHKFGENTALHNLIFRYSAPTDFQTPYRREIFVGCRYFAFPREVHGVQADRTLVTTHDTYHFYIECADLHRPIWIGIAMDLKEKDPKLWDQMLDREFPLYIASSPFKTLGTLNPNELFWLSLSDLCSRVKKMQDRTTILLTALAYVQKNEAFLKEKYSISFKNLKELFDKIEALTSTEVDYFSLLSSHNLLELEVLSRDLLVDI